MTICITKYHGSIDYAEQDVIDFPAGLPGFEEHTRFLPIEVPATRPIVYLQSVAAPETCFITLPAHVVDSGYELRLDPTDATLLGTPAGGSVRTGGDMLCLAIITIQPGEAATANLLAPVVVNMKLRRGVQVISTDPGHSHRCAFLADKDHPACS